MYLLEYQNNIIPSKSAIFHHRQQNTRMPRQIAPIYCFRHLSLRRHTRYSIPLFLVRVGYAWCYTNYALKYSVNLLFSAAYFLSITRHRFIVPEPYDLNSTSSSKVASLFLSSNVYLYPYFRLARCTGTLISQRSRKCLSLFLDKKKKVNLFHTIIMQTSFSIPCRIIQIQMEQNAIWNFTSWRNSPEEIRLDQAIEGLDLFPCHVVVSRRAFLSSVFLHFILCTMNNLLTNNFNK